MEDSCPYSGQKIYIEPTKQVCQFVMWTLGILVMLLLVKELSPVILYDTIQEMTHAASSYLCLKNRKKVKLNERAQTSAEMLRPNKALK